MTPTSERLDEIERHANHLAALPCPPAKVYLQEIYIANIMTEVNALRDLAKRNARALRKVTAPTAQED